MLANTTGYLCVCVWDKWDKILCVHFLNVYNGPLATVFIFMK